MRELCPEIASLPPQRSHKQVVFSGLDVAFEPTVYQIENLLAIGLKHHEMAVATDIRILELEILRGATGLSKERDNFRALHASGAFRGHKGNRDTFEILKLVHT